MALSTTITALILVLFPVSCLSFSSFSSFEFAPNGVCLKPRFFVDDSHTFTMRNVPGSGDCMFLAVALATATSMGLGGNDALLRAISKETRQVVASMLSLPNGNLFIQKGQRLVTTRDLLVSSSHKEGMAPDEYLRRLRLEGVEGGLYGGGPELAVLSNVLRRPISVYELDATSSLSDDQNQRIRCEGVFGAGVFEDPCVTSISNSAVLLAQQPGAYSWHLHILVVDVGSEKHACVLLPQEVV